MNSNKLWIGTAGEITCENHAGTYLKTAIANDPTARQHITPLDWYIIYTSGSYNCESCAKVSA